MLKSYNFDLLPNSATSDGRRALAGYARTYYTGYAWHDILARRGPDIVGQSASDARSTPPPAPRLNTRRPAGRPNCDFFGMQHSEEGPVGARTSTPHGERQRSLPNMEHAGDVA